MSIPKEPRQLMINLMYLVLTALLAMNVSNEILNAFKTIGKSIQRSNESTEVRNTLVTESFQKFIDNPKTNAEKKVKVQAGLVLANQVNVRTNTIIDELKRYRELIIQASGGYDEKGQIKQIENLDGGTISMIEQGNGPKLLAALQAYKDDIAGLVPLDDTKIEGAGNGNNKAIFDQLPLNFDTDKSDVNPSGDWSYGNFHMSPTIANVTLIDKYTSDVRASQSLALDNIWSLATGDPLTKPQVFSHPTNRTFNDYAIIVAADNSYVLPGEKYHAKIMLGTYNKNLNNLTFNVNGRTISPVDGVADFTDVANAVGAKNISVTATFRDTIAGSNPRQLETRTITLAKPAQYFVGEAQASISLDKMNVFYMGVDNPITLSASGIQSSNLSVNPGAGITLTPVGGQIGKFTVNTTATQPGKTSITLTAKLPDGGSKTFGPFEYRIKRIPDPFPTVATKKGGIISLSELKVQTFVKAQLDNFDFDARFAVTSFDVTLQPKRSTDLISESITGELLTDQKASSVIGRAKIGDRISFENIKARGPDGTPRSIGSINFYINN
jgi:gliding motility-associated protein GldM